MKQRARKLVGTMALLGLIAAYAIAVGAIYANFLGGQPWWVLIIFFAVAGTLWFFPAAWTIRWMTKPD